MDSRNEIFQNRLGYIVHKVVKEDKGLSFLRIKFLLCEENPDEEENQRLLPIDPIYRFLTECNKV